jgi:hypothetical protein
MACMVIVIALSGSVAQRKFRLQAEPGAPAGCRGRLLAQMLPAQKLPTSFWACDLLACSTPYLGVRVA